MTRTPEPPDGNPVQRILTAYSYLDSTNSLLSWGPVPGPVRSPSPLFNSDSLCAHPCDTVASLLFSPFVSRWSIRPVVGGVA